MSIPESRISELIRTSLEKIREVVDVNTVVGEPVWNEKGITVIPVSKLSVGTASGGLDRFSKNVASPEKPGDKAGSEKPGGSFGGGGGIGVNVTPLGFLVIKESGNVEFLSIAASSTASTAVTIVDTVSDFLDRSPELIEKLKKIFKGKDKQEVEGEGESAGTEPTE